jgi:N-acetylmuramoyl-L-alanine amidase
MQRSILVLGLMIAAVLGLPAISQPALAALEHVEIFGRDCIRISDWAESAKLEAKWTKPEEEYTLSSKWSKLVFTVDSRQAVFNDVVVYLSHPVARKGAEAYLAYLDLTTTVRPLLYPIKNSKSLKIKTVCLDPGHGGRDPGNQEGKYQEKKYTLLLAYELEKQLKSAGFKVVLTRPGDDFADLTNRPIVAEKKKSDLFISLHFNAASDASVKGAETYCMTPARASSTNARGEGANTGTYPGNRMDDKNILLAWTVQKALNKALETDDRGVRRARFAVLRQATMPAILVESAFMTNSGESKKIYDSAWRQKMAKAITEGVQEYKKLVEK